MTSHHGGSHFSKRSESESNKEGNQKSENQKRKRERKGLESKKKVWQTSKGKTKVKVN